MTAAGFQKLKSAGHQTKDWAHNKHILQDSAVDRAIDKAKTDLLYKKFLEQKRKEEAPEKVRDLVRPTINDATPLEIQKIKKLKQQTLDDNVNDIKDNDNTGYDSLDELERELGLADNDEETLAIRQIHDRRKAEIKQSWKKKQREMAIGAGTYSEMDERDLLKLAAKGSNVVIHFYHTNITICKIVDEHLRRIAPKHSEARFVKLNASKSPFLVNKWKIRTLPSICNIVNGYLVDKIIGFDEFGGKEDFPTVAMVKRLAKVSVIKDPNTGKFRKQNLRTQVLTDL